MFKQTGYSPFIQGEILQNWVPDPIIPDFSSYPQRAVGQAIVVDDDFLAYVDFASKMEGVGKKHYRRKTSKLTDHKNKGRSIAPHGVHTKIAAGAYWWQNI
ncbi:MAG: hypothetical protein N4A44_04045 [Alphaproteobacteria bacterium]|nr:hypothetical protein [Alphaproteobacteria bacterium]